MSALRHTVKALLPAPVRRAIRTVAPPSQVLGTRMIERAARRERDVEVGFELMTDDDAYNHFGPENLLVASQLRAGIRFFHGWKLAAIRSHLGSALAAASVLDVGDSDGLMLKHLGKDGTGFNLSPEAIANIERNGVRAVIGDGHRLPFDDGTFDVVLSFQMLEHVENQQEVLVELARVCKPNGRCFLSVPWVPQTVVHPLNPAVQRGEDHIFELSPRDLRALVTHTPFTLVGDGICDLFAAPRGPWERLLLFRNRNEHVVLGTFRRFYLVVLERSSAVSPP